jgi:hypothetical protein
MTREEKLKLLLDIGEYDFIKYISKENMWKLIFALAYIEDTIPMSDIDGIKEKIKTEISDYEGCADFYEGIRFGLRTALEIIDKYRESEE